MTRIEYNKLIRDRVKEKIEASGDTCEVRIVTDPLELAEELRKKIVEEAGELASAKGREDFLSEYADLMVVLDALTKLMELTEADIKVAIEENLTKKGVYNSKHFLVWAESKN